MPVSCPTNNTSVEKFWIPLFDDQTLDLESKKKSQLLVIEYLQGFQLLRTEMICHKCIAMSGVLIQVHLFN
ncbi:unnamed protein product [Meloidogyne enterolobii]|uniref:Uncharacterized protein n=1 Tax=Meloidogyne enterolobii TaxID=390850 RepID=A0ACB0Z191_MELEN